MAVGSSSLFRRRRLGEELRTLRDAKGLTLTALAAELGWSHTKISRLENAKVRPDVGEVMDLLEALGVDRDTEQRLIALARQANQRGWWRAFADMPARQAGIAELEAGALSIREYGSVFVPGLLQTEAYARVRFRDGDALRSFDLEDALKGRLARQDILTRQNPVEYTAVLDESVLRRQTAPGDVMAEQISSLSGRVRVLPFDALEYPPLNTFALFRFPEDDDLAVVETETSDLQLGDEEDVARYAIMWQRLDQAALDLSASADLIRSIEETWNR